jgi:hypothetical protein
MICEKNKFLQPDSSITIKVLYEMLNVNDVKIFHFMTLSSDKVDSWIEKKVKQCVIESLKLGFQHFIKNNFKGKQLKC